MVLEIFITFNKLEHSWKYNGVVQREKPEIFNAFIHNVEKWPNILLKSCGVNTAKFLKYVLPFFNIRNERVKITLLKINRI